MRLPGPGRMFLLLCILAIYPSIVLGDYAPSFLGTLGGEESWATDVNNSGAIVGCSTDASGRQRAFLWTADGGMIDLGTLGGENAAATGINDAGEIVGWSETADGARHAFLRTSEQEMVDLGVLPGDTASESFAVADIVVGASVGYGSRTRAFFWSVDTNLVELAPLFQGGDTWAFGVNTANVIVGAAVDPSGSRRAVLWGADGKVRDLVASSETTGAAYGINEAGIVVGESRNTSNLSHAFCWTESLGMRRLPDPTRLDSARALSVNNSNQIVGYALGRNKRAVVWGVSRDLVKRFSARVVVLPMPRGMVESEAVAINDAGLIVGYCRGDDGRKRAVVWRLAKKDKSRLSMALTGGLFIPVSSKTRNEFTSAWFRVAVQPFKPARQTRPYLTIDSAVYRLDGPTRARLYEITFGVERGLDPGRVAQHYLAVRAGPYYGALENGTTGASQRKWGLNVNASYGLIFLRSLYAEARYDYFSPLGGYDFSGISLTVGLRLFDLPR
ncbi:MAG: DUF3466 family protein [Armatimonadetes bacterium]|nr:DUF3466 family protein [Armatimonadota bacterium]